MISAVVFSPLLQLHTTRGRNLHDLHFDYHRPEIYQKMKCICDILPLNVWGLCYTYPHTLLLQQKKSFFQRQGNVLTIARERGIEKKRKKYPSHVFFLYIANSPFSLSKNNLSWELSYQGKLQSFQPVSYGLYGSISNKI